MSRRGTTRPLLRQATVPPFHSLASTACSTWHRGRTRWRAGRGTGRSARGALLGIPAIPAVCYLPSTSSRVLRSVLSSSRGASVVSCRRPPWHGVLFLRASFPASLLEPGFRTQESPAPGFECRRFPCVTASVQCCLQCSPSVKEGGTLRRAFVIMVWARLRLCARASGAVPGRPK